MKLHARVYNTQDKSRNTFMIADGMLIYRMYPDYILGIPPSLYKRMGSVDSDDACELHVHVSQPLTKEKYPKAQSLLKLRDYIELSEVVSECLHP